MARTAYWRKIGAETGITLNTEDIAELIRPDVLMWTSLNQSMVTWARSLGWQAFALEYSLTRPDPVNAMEKQFLWANRLR
jgi:hypothetical protein